MSTSCRTTPSVTLTSVYTVSSTSISQIVTETIIPASTSSITTTTCRPIGTTATRGSTPTSTASVEIECLPTTSTTIWPAQTATLSRLITLTVELPSTVSTTLYGTSCTIVPTSAPNTPGDPKLPHNDRPSQELATVTSTIFSTTITTVPAPDSPSSTGSPSLTGSPSTTGSATGSRFATPPPLGQDSRNPSGNSVKIGVIIGGALGGLVVFVLLVLALFLLFTRRKRGSGGAVPRAEIDVDDPIPPDLEPKPYTYDAGLHHGMSVPTSDHSRMPHTSSPLTRQGTMYSVSGATDATGRISMARGPQTTPLAVANVGVHSTTASICADCGGHATTVPSLDRLGRSNQGGRIPGFTTGGRRHNSMLAIPVHRSQVGQAQALRRHSTMMATPPSRKGRVRFIEGGLPPPAYEE